LGASITIPANDVAIAFSILEDAGELTVSSTQDSHHAFEVWHERGFQSLMMKTVTVGIEASPHPCDSQWCRLDHQLQSTVRLGWRTSCKEEGIRCSRAQRRLLIVTFFWITFVCSTGRRLLSSNMEQLAGAPNAQQRF
jgi:hypothetical protein